MLIKDQAVHNTQTLLSGGEVLTHLFEKSLAGDEASYQLFLEQIAVFLRLFLLGTRFAQRRSEKIEDLVQDVLLTIHRKRDLYRPGMPVVPWIRTIAKYRLIDSLRADRRSPETTELLESLHADFHEDHLINCLDVRRLLDGLGDHQKQILILAKVHGLPHCEIASLMGTTLGSVKVAVHRSLMALRRNLDAKN